MEIGKLLRLFTNGLPLVQWLGLEPVYTRQKKLDGQGEARRT